MPDKEKYENDVHNCTNPQLADLLDKLAASLNGSRPIGDVELIRESAKRLRIKQRGLFNSEQFNM
jgi:hypothetical protein